MSEQEFRVKSDEALEQARQALLPLADDDGFEVELQNGVLEPRLRGAGRREVRRLAERAGAPDLGLGDGAELQAGVGAEHGAFALNGETLPRLLDRLTRDVSRPPEMP